MQVLSITKDKEEELWLSPMTKVPTPKERQKGGDLTQSYDKSPYTPGNVKRGSDNTNNATKKFD